jgi:ornithine cyclodeaminase/alanine dehydrogenase-like protein (mu-crystallin family)
MALVRELVELGEILDRTDQRDPDAITVATLVGIDVQDVVAAEIAFTLPRKQMRRRRSSWPGP